MLCRPELPPVHTVWHEQPFSLLKNVNVTDCPINENLLHPIRMARYSFPESLITDISTRNWPVSEQYREELITDLAR